MKAGGACCNIDSARSLSIAIIVFTILEIIVILTLLEGVLPHETLELGKALCRVSLAVGIGRCCTTEPLDRLILATGPIETVDLVGPSHRDCPLWPSKAALAIGHDRPIAV